MTSEQTGRTVAVEGSTLVVVEPKGRMIHRADCPFVRTSVVRAVRSTDAMGMLGHQALPYCERCRGDDRREVRARKAAAR